MRRRMRERNCAGWRFDEYSLTSVPVVELPNESRACPDRLALAYSTPMTTSAFDEAFDGEIDALVYKLYGLTADEIKTVEGTAK